MNMTRDMKKQLNEAEITKLIETLTDAKPKKKEIRKPRAEKVDLRTPKEKEMDETLKKYKEEDAKLDKIESEKYAKHRVMFWDSIYVAGNFLAIYAFCWITGFLWGLDKAAGPPLSVLFVLFLGSLSAMGLFGLFVSWVSDFHGEIESHYKDHYLKTKEEKRLVSEKSDREEFYKFCARKITGLQPVI